MQTVQVQQMYYIAHAFGFVSDLWIVNGKKKLRFTKDIREAKPFTSVEEANELLNGATYGKHFAILGTHIEYSSSTPATVAPASSALAVAFGEDDAPNYDRGALDDGDSLAFADNDGLNVLAYGGA